MGHTNVLVRPTYTLLNKTIQLGLKVREYFAETLNHKVPVELVIPRTLNGSPHSRTLHRIKVGSNTLLNNLEQVALALTGDAWVLRPSACEFNLYDARVLYNGFNTGEYFTGQAHYSHVVAVALGPLCSNLTGIWLIPYVNEQAFAYTGFRADGGPLLDM